MVHLLPVSHGKPYFTSKNVPTIPLLLVHRVYLVVSGQGGPTNETILRNEGALLISLKRERVKTGIL